MKALFHGSANHVVGARDLRREWLLQRNRRILDHFEYPIRGIVESDDRHLHHDRLGQQLPHVARDLIAVHAIRGRQYA
jgi:hypothetical protein